MLESDIEKRIARKIRSRGGLCLKWVSPGFTGVPDRIILLPGKRILFAEIKRPGEDLRPRQKRVKAQLEALGFTVLRVTGEEDIDDYI
jgi:hypothetical protein